MPGPRIPQGVVTAAEWSWRLLVIAAVLALIWWLLQYFSGVAVPLAVAMLLSALLSPLNARLRRFGWPRVLASIGSLLAMVLVIGGVFLAIGAQVARELPELIDQSVKALATLVDWLAAGPLHIDQAQLDGYLAQFTTWVNESRAELASIAAKAGVGVGHFLAGLAIALIATFFFLASGREIWSSVVKLLPVHYQAPTLRAADNGWASLVAYMRAQVLVALVDAIGMLAGALILRLPMAWALFALTFVTAFIPVVGAVLSGAVACLLALVTHGPVSALIMLGITIAVVQTEGHFLQPILLGRAVSLHPLAVLIGLAVGATLAGIVGALLVIPVLAFSVAFIRGLDPARFKPVRLQE
ncbi:MAG TPA: AI-2E family transporter [Propionicimonas sp.]|nr:AI-2E family transporter [Propionicimonas sp.]HQA77829.1 AI-2E family transporter [Propionicimonas sp.]HQD96780.1 AI-2E family transporter [Propionicimonas sp.]